ncbi:hypothetical protein DFS34DRAFT_633632 [Phlyctochytrium arcticum]|nr:hypothetical protein DFS34DRAFT_633632 [Phlyctochytrium arcticum]
MLRALHLSTLAIASDCLCLKSFIANDVDRIGCRLLDSASSTTIDDWYRSSQAATLAQGMKEPAQIRGFLKRTCRTNSSDTASTGWSHYSPGPVSPSSLRTQTPSHGKCRIGSLAYSNSWLYGTSKCRT